MDDGDRQFQRMALATLGPLVLIVLIVGAVLTYLGY